MEIVVSKALVEITKALTSKLTGKIANDLYQKVKGDPAQKALKKALAAAIRDYASRDLLGLVFAQPLMQSDGPLTHPDVANELVKVIRFVDTPDHQVIGKRWMRSLSPRFHQHDFTKESEALIGYFEKELRDTEVFRPVFDGKSLDAIAVSSEESADALANIEEKLEELNSLLDVRFGQLIGSFARASGSIRSQIYDFSRTIADKARGFVGRQWVFSAVDDFITNNPRGYFFIIGDPGIGKSAIAAQMIKQNGNIHHFNIRSEGISKTSSFLRNICSQLIAAYQLDYTSVPPEASDDAGFLNKLLNQVAGKLGQEERCVIIIDALDEVERIGISDGANLLYLPLVIPEGVYIVVTMRDDPKIKPRVDCEQGELRIEHDSSDNLADVTDYLQSSIEQSGIKEYISSQNIGSEEFISMMLGKSEGNFMYLYHVIPELAIGAYRDRKLDKLPKGLMAYYQDHWQRMRGQDEEAWFKYRLPVIMALTVVKEPVSINLIADFSKVHEIPRIYAVLEDWSQFLHEEAVEYENDIQKRYRVYHESFNDFIASKEDLKIMHKQIADTLWNDLFGGSIKAS